jgi:hypothetical protein
LSEFHGCERARPFEVSMLEQNATHLARTSRNNRRRIVHSAGPDRALATDAHSRDRPGHRWSWLAAYKFGELGTMVAGIAAHLLMQDALAALLLPGAVDWEQAAAFRIGTGPDYRLGRGLATGHGRSSGLVKARWSAHFRGSARSKSERI